MQKGKWKRNLLRKAIEYGHELIKAALTLGFAELHPLRDAALDVGLDDRETDSIERRLSCRELLKDLDAESRLLHHPADPADLALDPVQAGDDGPLLGCVQHDHVYAAHELRVSRGCTMVPA